jgi:hypothetical protein
MSSSFYEATAMQRPAAVLIPTLIALVKQRVINQRLENPKDEECTLINTLETLPSARKGSNFRANSTCRFMMSTDLL